MSTLTPMALLAACLFLPLPALGTPYVQPPNATLVASFTDSLMKDCDGDLYATKEKKVCGWSVFVWLVGPGDYEFSFHAASTTFTDGCGSPDGLSTPEIFSMIAAATVRRGVERGYIPCPTSGSEETAVWFNACVERSGSGVGTQFTACGTGTNRIEFDYSCTNNVPSAVPTGWTSANCGTTCESTTTGGGGLM